MIGLLGKAISKARVWHRFNEVRVTVWPGGALREEDKDTGKEGKYKSVEGEERSVHAFMVSPQGSPASYVGPRDASYSINHTDVSRPSGKQRKQHNCCLQRVFMQQDLSSQPD